MPRPKIRVKKLRATGCPKDSALADWIERKELARAKGVVMHEWIAQNPKPMFLKSEDENAVEALKKKELEIEMQFNKVHSITVRLSLT